MAVNGRVAMIAALVCILIGAAAGAYLMYHFKVVDLKDQVADLKLELALYKKDLQSEQQKPAKIITDTKYVTDVQYVPKEKEIVIYKDPKTGQEVKGQERTDMQASVGKVDFYMLFNGREVKLDKAEDESFMFDKYKLVLTQTGKITLDVTAIVEALVAARLDGEVAKRIKHAEVGAGLSNHGIYGGVKLRLSDRLSVQYDQSFGQDQFKGGRVNYAF